MREKELSEKVNHDPKHLKMAIGIASDPRHKGGDYSGAHKKIEKIAKGLASHPQVAAVLKKQNEAVKEGLGDLAHAAEKDHEVQMARADLYKLAKYAIKLHDMLKGISEAEGLEGWVQSKITKSADMIGSVYHHLDYQESPMAEVTEATDTCGHCGCEVGNPKPGCDCKEDCHAPVNEAVEMCPEACCGKPVTECSCGPDCKHCDCYAKNKMNEGKFKSDAQRKAIHASKASGKKSKTKLRRNTESLQAKLAAKLETKITPTNISATKIKSKKIEPKTESK